MPSDGTMDDLLDAMKRAAAALRDRGVPFALAGGLAIYARGGPETGHDVDFVLRERDAKTALEVLADAGFRCEQPPEGWLYKVFDEKDAMVDLIYAPNNQPERVDDILERTDELEVYAVTMPVMSVTDVLATKLLALKEHELDYEPVLEIARACREQVDWELLRELTRDSPYAKAFFTLVAELGLAANAA
ncbi:MAG TPA: nucleotidyltransferase [Gaiellaceae bacterium]|nr:nucleotidyltransferase [Gaiellaceae bacterium]